MGTLKSYTIVFLLGCYVSLIDGQAHPQNCMFAPPSPWPLLCLFGIFCLGSTLDYQKKKQKPHPSCMNYRDTNKRGHIHEHIHTHTSTHVHTHTLTRIHTHTRTHTHTHTHTRTHKHPCTHTHRHKIKNDVYLFQMRQPCYISSGMRHTMH